MKKLLLLMLAIAGLMSLSLQAQEKVEADKKYPIMTFEQTKFDLGTLHEGDIVERTYKFKNTGDAPLIISKIKASCGCTVPSGWSKEPILPGQEGEFKVKFNTRNKINKQHKIITVYANTQKGRELVSFEANVIPDPKMEQIRKERRERWLRQREEIRKKKIKEQKDKKDKLATPSEIYDKQKNKEEKIKKKAEAKEQKAIAKKEKAVAKKEKELEKEKERVERIKKKIKKRREDIRKVDKKINRKEKRLKKQTAKGKLSPNDIEKREKELKELKEKRVRLEEKIVNLERKL